MTLRKRSPRASSDWLPSWGETAHSPGSGSFKSKRPLTSKHPSGSLPANPGRGQLRIEREADMLSLSGDDLR